MFDFLIKRLLTYLKRTFTLKVYRHDKLKQKNDWGDFSQCERILYIISFYKSYMNDNNEQYDFLIIGAGVAGLAAAMYGARLGMKTLCLGATHGSELPVGGGITTTNVVENYPGFIRLT